MTPHTDRKDISTAPGAEGRPDSGTDPKGLMPRLLRTMARVLARQGFDGIARYGNALGALLWHCLPGRRRLAIGAIAGHLGVSQQEAARIARESFAHNARSFLELVLVGQFGFELGDERLIIDNPDRLRRITESQRPLVAATAHLGAWEFMGSLLGQWQLDRPRMVVVRRNSNRTLNDFIFAMRGARGLQVVDHRNAVFTVLKGLKRNGCVGFLVDHNCRRDEAIFLPFLGETAAVNMGPALLAVRAEAEVWPAFMIREGDRYRLYIDEPLDTATLNGDRNDKVEAVCRFYTQAVERAVRAHPEQWFWMHKRWKTRPKHDD
ncbi:acyltransferase [Nitratidesulfovibrio liaohensis]|uniref:Acyltransferase n=1 Tax=Nitratidesulfovibrio liaohensis TaxID=2604158 RepID=A0ABY9R483_9BACT|nr:acyltransferase [Nitratidesulfovibrio liaohensis]WMW65937.1 acyltransferase [Nitratidesulfovibrio liaohensis]